MKPEAIARRILSTTRATAKLHEFRVPQEDFIELPRDPSMLFALAVGLLGDVSATIASQTQEVTDVPIPEVDPIPPNWDDSDPSPPEALHFASLFFDAYLNSRLDDTITTEFSLLCASAYYLGGNVGSAAVITRQIEAPELELAGGLGRLVYSILGNNYHAISGDHVRSELTADLLTALGGFITFQNGSEAVTSRCATLRHRCYANGSPRELLYCDIAVALSLHKLRNSARALLPKTTLLEAEAWRPALGKPHFPVELWPAQQRIAAAGLLQGRSAVIQMPTSAGKTRATELIIRAAFLSQRASLAVIVAPYRSLCHDIRGDLANAFAGEPISLDEASDSYQFDLGLDELFAQQTVLIVTPEKLLYMLRRAPELADRIGLVIYDEGHQFDGMARGPTYELLLTSLRIALPRETQIVLMSAVVGNAAELADWLIRDADAVVGGEGLLPTTKSIAFASWQDARGRLEYVRPEDPEDREFFVPRIITQMPLARRSPKEKERLFPEKNGGDVGLFLGLHVVANGSVAIFCGRKDSASKLCRRAVEIFERDAAVQNPIEVSDAIEIERIRALSAANLGPNADATRAASIGIFAHHADTPHGLRLSIEHAMKEGLAKFVICTSTLAQGVNFPIRYLIVTATQQGRERIMVRDFHNLIGRAGRAGMHTEGSVIFSSPAIYDARNTRTRRWRWIATSRLLDQANSEPCQSSILKLFSDYEQRQRGAPPIVQEMRQEWLDLAFADRERIDAVVAEALLAQPNISTPEFRKFIEDRARAVQSIAAYLVTHMTFDEDDASERVIELAANTFAYHLADDETRGRLTAVFETIAVSIVAHADEDLRSLIRQSPLPPASIADLQIWLTENLEEIRGAAAQDTLLEVITGVVLSHASSRSIQALSDDTIVPAVLLAWAGGQSFQEIHAMLREAGIKVSGKWPTVESAVALCENGFGYGTAMIVASLADLIEPLDQDLFLAMSFLQKQVKYGLPDPAAIAFFEAGFADRVVASALGAQWPTCADRGGVRSICRLESNAVSMLLSEFPSYFSAVAAELGR